MFYQITLQSGERILARRNVRASEAFAERLAIKLQMIHRADKFTIEPITDKDVLTKFTAQISALSIMLVVSISGQILDDQFTRTPRPQPRTIRTRKIS